MDKRPPNTSLIPTPDKLQDRMEQLNALKEQYAHLENELRAIEALFAKEVRPLVWEYCEAILGTLQVLRSHLSDPEFSKREKRRLLAMIQNKALDLWENFGDERALEFLETRSPEFEERSEETLDVPRPKAHVDENVQKTSKTLYRDLMKVLHPDLESDEGMKAIKTEMVKELTDAYQRNDFQALLRLKERHGTPDHNPQHLLKGIESDIQRMKREIGALKSKGPLSYFYKSFYSSNPHTTRKRMAEAREQTFELAQEEIGRQKMLRDREYVRASIKYELLLEQRGAEEIGDYGLDPQDIVELILEEESLQQNRGRGRSKGGARRRRR